MPSKRGQTRSISTLVSSNPDLTEDRKAALEMIVKFQKTPHTTTELERRWFWNDMDDEDSDSYALAKEVVREDKNFAILNTAYPFELTEWLMEWYTYMPDALYLKKDSAGQIDWNLLFTLISPIRFSGYNFKCLIRAINVRQNQIAREQIYKEVLGNPKLKEKVLNWQPIPSIYTHYTPYGKIHDEVVKRLKPDKREVAPSGSYKIFKQIEKLTNSGLDFPTALQQASENTT